jgi:hypothetical protein
MFVSPATYRAIDASWKADKRSRRAITESAYLGLSGLPMGGLAAAMVRKNNNIL